MVTLPIKVKTRDPSGAVAEILCDTVSGAISNAKQFRETGHKDVWMEDVNGRLVDERTLHA
jgi:hypothetical protein